MPRIKRPAPTTCKEAADRFTEKAERAHYPEQVAYAQGARDVLSCFGDVPIPQGLLDEYDWDL